MTQAVERKHITCMACSVQCGLVADLSDGRVVKLIGDAAHPTSHGFSCPKGREAVSLQNRPDRLRAVHKRVGERGGGQWTRIPWDQAMDEIAEQVRQLAQRHGPETVAYGLGTLHSPDNGLGERFLNLLGSPNTVGQDKICYGPTSVAEILTYGWGPGMFPTPVPGVTGCQVFWGFRPSASSPLAWSASTKARKAGTRLIVVDPIRTMEADKADLFLQLRPGTDAALALGLIGVIVAENLYDHAFVDEQTVGFAELADRAAGFPPDRVEQLTGVPAADIAAAARMFAGNGPAVLHGANGVCQSGTTAFATGRALASLIAITGNLGRPGGHTLVGPPRDIVATGEAVLADRLPPRQRAKRLGADRFPLIGAGYQALSEAVAQAWHGDRHVLNGWASAHEPALWEAIRDRRPYPVTALFLQNHNPVGASANLHDVESALRSPNLELLVVQDLFLTKSASLADYVLPAAHWLEKPFYSTGYGYVGFYGDYVEAHPAAMRGDCPSDYDLWRDLGRRLGQPWPERAEEFWDSLLQPAGLTYRQVCEHPGPMVGDAVRAPSPRRPAGDGRAFGTPSGKVELRSSLLADWGFDPLPGYEPPAIFAQAPDEFPLVLTTGGRTISGHHQNAQQMPTFRARNPHPIARLHPKTAAAHGIADGDWIEIRTPIGAVRHLAVLTETLQEQTVQADRWWYPEHAGHAADPFGVWSTNINVCTDNSVASCDPVVGGWLLRALPCAVVKAEIPVVATISADG